MTIKEANIRTDRYCFKAYSSLDIFKKYYDTPVRNTKCWSENCFNYDKMIKLVTHDEVRFRYVGQNTRNKVGRVGNRSLKR
jgi:hypothetical protein